MLSGVVSRRVLIGLAVIWAMAVAPLTLLGFGSDTDAWLVADLTDYIAAHGRYLRSRSTGFPLYELAVTPLVQAGNWYLSNQLAFAGGLALFAVLGSLARRGHYRHPSLVLIAIMFLPVVVKNGSVTMDYLPALALLAGAYLLLLEGRLTAAAICIGVATGIRPSSLALAGPAALYAWQRSGRLAPALRLVIIAAVIGLVAFSPSLLLQREYGLARTMPALKGAYNALRLIGVLQAAALAALFAFWRPRVSELLRTWRTEPLVVFHVAVIVTWLLMFAPMPDEPEYLLPLIPSAIWLLDRLLTGRQFAVVTAVLLSYHVISLDVGGTRGGTRPPVVSLGPGFTVADVQDRLFKLSLRELATNWRGTTPTLLMEQALAITARNPAWVLDPTVDEYRQLDGHLYVSLRYYREESMRRFHEHGVRVVVMKSREWEFHQPGRDTAWPYIEFVDDLEEVLGGPIRGRPMW